MRFIPVLFFLLLAACGPRASIAPQTVAQAKAELIANTKGVQATGSVLLTTFEATTTRGNANLPRCDQIGNEDLGLTRNTPALFIDTNGSVCGQSQSIYVGHIIVGSIHDNDYVLRPPPDEPYLALTLVGQDLKQVGRR